MTDRCIFCRIVSGAEEASRVYEDDAVVAFLDRGDGGRMFEAARKLAAAVRRSGLRCEGVNLLLNDGAEAGQRVFHAHLHVIPRYVGDNARLRRTEGPVPSREELEEVAAQIRQALDQAADA